LKRKNRGKKRMTKPEILRRIGTLTVLLAAAASAFAAPPPPCSNGSNQCVAITSVTPSSFFFLPGQTVKTVTISYTYSNFTGSSATITASSPADSHLLNVLTNQTISTGAGPFSGTITLSVPSTTDVCAPKNTQVDIQGLDNANDKANSGGGASFSVVTVACLAANPGGVGGLKTTTTTVIGNPNPSNVGQAVTMTATVTGSTVSPTGSVDFFDATTLTDLGTAPLTTVAGVVETATLTNVTSLALGAHTILATYLGDTIYLASQGQYIQTVETNSASLKACKFYDANNNHLNDDSQPIQGWSMTLDGTTSQATGADGCTQFDNLQLTSHSISEGTLSAHYVQTALIVNGSALTPATSTNVTLTADNTSTNPATVVFGNNKQITLSGTKYYDANSATPGASTNEDGTKNNSEVGIGGIKVTTTECAAASCLTGYIGTPDVQFTAPVTGNWSSGPYVFGTNGTTARNFLICETLPTVTATGFFFVQTGPTPNVTPAQGSSCYFGAYTANTTGRDFGNVCIGTGLTRDGSKGSWANNFAGDISTSSVSLLGGENLVDNDGNPVSITTAAQAAAFLGGTGTHSNLAYQLSLQLAAMTINNNQILKPGISTVWVAPPASLSACGLNGNYFTISQLLTAANTSIGANPLNTVNACQDALRIQLDAMNNNTSVYVQTSAAACPFVTPY
jgi:hypothetical protein